MAPINGHVGTRLTGTLPQLRPLVVGMARSATLETDLRNAIVSRFEKYLPLREVVLKSQEVVYEPGDTVTKVYFPKGAVISLVVMVESGQATETAMLGADGMLGASDAMDGKSSLNRAVVQIAGPASLCGADEFKQAAEQNSSLMALIFRHERAVLAQSQQSAACRANHEIEARLACWMLRARALSGKEKLNFTQEYLAEALGVSRPSVSIAAHRLQNTGHIRYNRGVVEILNAAGLEGASCECYDVVNEHYKTLLGVNQ